MCNNVDMFDIIDIPYKVDIVNFSEGCSGVEKLNLKYKDAKRAVETLQDIIKEPYSIIIRDAAIQRFEYTFEVYGSS